MSSSDDFDGERKEITITILPFSVRLCSIKKEDKERLAYSIIKTFFFPPNTRRCFSYLETETEVRLIIGEALAYFPQDTIQVSPESWKALQICVGESGYTGMSISALSAPLASEKISIFYLSTFSEDFILVQEHKLEAAVNCLRKNFNVEFDGADNLPLANVPRGQHHDPSPAVQTFSPQSLQLSTMPTRLFLASLSKENISRNVHHLLKIFMYTQVDSSFFFSFTETEEEVTLLLTEKLLQLFPEGALVVTDCWRPLKRVVKRGFNEMGIVSALSKPLADVHIPTLYISSYETSYLLVPEKQMEEAIRCLREANIPVEELQTE
eukprot:TRINITY_DN7361_c0_g1_i1.p1 TRINITY_DN7361_c0_g1~~TRINITY_DN7361_c0_g1_i1.p1  ORF type:complete len:324 (+),score=56.43 TRINITY_DN7361_c0_g1_i1:210-1181(+)